MADDQALMPILDVREASEFQQEHAVGAVNIPLPSLAERMSELPPHHVPFLVFDADPTRQHAALRILHQAGRRSCLSYTSSEHGALDFSEVGPTTRYLWSPHALLVRALKVMRAVWGDFDQRNAVDLACGVGREAATMALAGLTVSAWDILPDGLQRARQLAGACGAKVQHSVVDLENDQFQMPKSAFDVACCFHYLHRPLLPEIVNSVRDGGFVVYETFTVEQRKRLGKPRKDKHLLRSGELASYFAGWHTFWNAEGWSNGRWVASFIAQKPYSATELG